MQTELPNDYYPLLAGYYDESDFEAYRSMWRTFRELPEFSRNLLTSEELPLALKALADRFGFDQSTTAFVSVLVRKVIFREWDEEQAKAELAAWCQEFDKINTPRCEEILEVVKKDILTIVPKEEEKPGEIETRVTTRLALLEALSQYPQLGQQTITETRIKLKSSAELVRGSIINWLKCYREELGVGYHDAMLRGQFLFRSQNGLRLTNEERGHIEILLRSIEDREAVEIDTVHQALIFPPYSGPKNPQPEEEKAPIPNIPFISPAAAPVLMPAQLREKSVTSVDMPVKETFHQSLGETGSLHVLSKNQLSPLNQTIGTLHFSSKHVLPVEKEIPFSAQGGHKNAETIPSRNINTTVSSLANSELDKAHPGEVTSIPTATVATNSNTVSRPAPAPKRNVNRNYIPTPFRIDPIQREQPEKES